MQIIEIFVSILTGVQIYWNNDVVVLSGLPETKWNIF